MCSIFLTKSQCLKILVVTAVYQVKQLPKQYISTCYFTVYAVLWSEK